MLCEAISKTRKNVSSDIQTLRSWLKKTRLHLVFFNPLLSVWISDETLFLVFDILHQNREAISVFVAIFVQRWGKKCFSDSYVAIFFRFYFLTALQTR